MTEYFIRTIDEKYIDIITATDTKNAIYIFKQKYNLKRYRKFFVIKASYIFG